jgi:ribonuclease HIII
MQNTLTRKISKEESDRYLTILESRGYKITYNPGQYILWRAQGEGLTISFYTSGSFVSQGATDMSFLEVPSITSKTFKPHAGSDEVGKGDYFGPLVVCGVYLEDDSVKDLGIADSKKITDKKILSIYNKIKDSVKYSVKVIYPEIYNSELKNFENVSYFLASLHAQVADDLIKKYNLPKTDYVVDQFSLNKGRLVNAFKGLNLNLIQFHKGESDLAVACASVIARATFLIEMDKMGEKYGTIFPKGATDVINFGIDFVSKHGNDELKNVAKISFRTTSSIL